MNRVNGSHDPNAVPSNATVLRVFADVEREPWTDVDPATVLHGLVERVGLLRHGTDGGRASVAVLIRLDDGRALVAETTYRLARAAARALGASPIAAEET